jgi:hypothetical protein
MLMHLMPIKQTQEQILLQMGPDNPIVTLENYHNTLSDLVKNAGLGDSSRYWTNPTTKPDWKPEPKQDPAMMKAQADMATAKAKMEMDRQKHQQDLELERDKAQSAMALEQFKAQAKIQIDRENAIAQAAITANQELARSGVFGNAAADGLPPDDPQAVAGSLEAILKQGMTGLQGDVQGGMPGQPMQGAGLSGLPAGAPGESPEGMDDAAEQPEEPEEPEDNEDAMQTQVLTTLADTMRQQGEANIAAQKQVADAMATMAQALAKLSGPRSVRRGPDGKIAGVE